MMYLFVFLLDLLTAFLWAMGIKAVSGNRPLAAAMWSGLITLASALSLVAINKDLWMLIPAVVGSSVGTYLGAKEKEGR